MTNTSLFAEDNVVSHAYIRVIQAIRYANFCVSAETDKEIIDYIPTLVTVVGEDNKSLDLLEYRKIIADITANN